MKLSLQLKLGQQLTMTPQLQQAIRLLQLSTLDLQQEIHQALESNPMLELIENNREEDDITDPRQTALPRPTRKASRGLLQACYDSTRDNAELNSDDTDWQSDIPSDIDAWRPNWDDAYSGTSLINLAPSMETPLTLSLAPVPRAHCKTTFSGSSHLTHMSEKDSSIALRNYRCDR